MWPVTLREKEKFNLLKAHLQVSDYFTYTGPRTYTWDNRRSDGTRVLARLDRTYTFHSPSGQQSQYVTQHEIMGDCNLSDHLPIKLSIELGAERSAGSSYKLNSKYLYDPSILEQMVALWKSYQGQMDFFGKLHRLTKWYNTPCLRKTESRAHEVALRERLQQAQETLQQHLACPSAQATLTEIQDEVSQYETQRVEGQLLRSRVKWRAKGDSGTQEFYRAVQYHTPPPPHQSHRTGRSDRDATPQSSTDGGNLS